MMAFIFRPSIPPESLIRSDVEVDGLVLLPVLLRRREVLLAGKAVEGDYRKDHVDLVADDPTRRGTGLRDRGVPKVAGQPERIGVRALRRVGARARNIRRLRLSTIAKIRSTRIFAAAWNVA